MSCGDGGGGVGERSGAFGKWTESERLLRIRRGAVNHRGKTGK